jgi:hypothetical protein
MLEQPEKVIATANAAAVTVNLVVFIVSKSWLEVINLTNTNFSFLGKTSCGVWQGALANVVALARPISRTVPFFISTF